MTERERWIVYPLLFLALGAALRDKLFDRTWSRNMVCEALVLVDASNDRPTEPSILGVMGRAQPGAVAAVPEGGQLMVDVVRARTVIADNFQYQGIPLRPTLRLVPSLLPADPSRRLPRRPTPLRPESASPQAEPANPAGPEGTPEEPPSPEEPPAAAAEADARQAEAD